MQFKGAISFHNVCFTYPSRPDQPVLTNFSLDIPAGSTVAFVGPSGCGKSSLLALLQRQYDPDSGHITVDGVPLTDINLASMAELLGVVGQEPKLFSTTVRANIAMGATEAASEADIVEAAARVGHALLLPTACGVQCGRRSYPCQRVNVHTGCAHCWLLARAPSASRVALVGQAQAKTFISRLPQGLDTEVGERGVVLSGGQKQRIAIARWVWGPPGRVAGAQAARPPARLAPSGANRWLVCVAAACALRTRHCPLSSPSVHTDGVCAVLWCAPNGSARSSPLPSAILCKPLLLLLDEATSALDTVSERIVQRALDKLLQREDGGGRTTLIVAHRLSTVKVAVDHVCVCACETAGAWWPARTLTPQIPRGCVHAGCQPCGGHGRREDCGDGAPRPPSHRCAPLQVLLCEKPASPLAGPRGGGCVRLAAAVASQQPAVHVHNCTSSPTTLAWLHPTMCAPLSTTRQATHILRGCFGRSP